MKADIYHTDKSKTFLVLPNGMSISSVPEAILTELGAIKFWKTVELLPTIIGLSPKQIENDFAKQGYSIARYAIKSGIKETGLKKRGSK